jgi:hypothetical protein
MEILKDYGIFYENWINDSFKVDMFYDIINESYSKTFWIIN